MKAKKGLSVLLVTAMASVSLFGCGMKETDLAEKNAIVGAVPGTMNIYIVQTGESRYWSEYTGSDRCSSGWHCPGAERSCSRIKQSKITKSLRLPAGWI